MSLQGTPVFSRRRADMLPKAASAVTLIGKPNGKRDFHIGTRQQLHGALDPPSYQIVARRNPDRLLESAQKVADGKIGQLRQGNYPDPLIDVVIDILAYPSHHARW